MEESVDLHEEECKENKQTLANLSPSEEATSKDEVEIDVFVPLLSCLATNNILLTELGRSVWENLDLGCWYRPHCVPSVLATSFKILPYRPPARLIRAK